MNATEMIAALAACAVPPDLMAAVVSAALIIGDQAVRAQHHHRTQAAERQRRKRAADAEGRCHVPRHVTLRDDFDAPTRDKENKQTNNNQEGTNDNHLIPEEWSPSEEDRAYAVAKGIDVEAETRRYVEYWRGRGRSRALAWRKDWSEAWRYHCDHYAHHPRPSPQRPVQARPGRVGNVWAAEARKALANLPADWRKGIAA